MPSLPPLFFILALIALIYAILGIKDQIQHNREMKKEREKTKNKTNTKTTRNNKT